MSNDAPNPWSNPATGGEDGGWGQPADPWSSAPTTATPNQSLGEEAWRSAPPPTMEMPTEAWGQPDQDAATGWEQPAGSTTSATGWEQPAQSTPSATGWDQPAHSTHSAAGWDQPATPSWDQPAAAAPAEPSWQQPASEGFSQPAASVWTDPAQPAANWAGAPAPVTQPAAQPYNPYETAGAAYPVVYAYDQPTTQRSGMVPLVLSLIALGLSLFLSWLCYSGFKGLVAVTGTTDLDSSTLPPEANGPLAKVMVGMIGQVVPSIIGLVAFILAIIATKDPSARTKAIIGLVISVLAPIVSFIAWFVMVSTIPQFSA